MVKARDVSEIGLVAGIAFGLSFVKLYHMPQGGSVTLENIPVLIYAFMRGWKKATICGGILGILVMISDPYFVHPVQVILDYPLPFALLGFAGMFSEVYIGVSVAVTLKFLSHLVSGAVFFANYAPKGVNPWFYSLVYNGTTALPNLIIALVLVPVLIRRLKCRK